MAAMLTLALLLLLPPRHYAQSDGHAPEQQGQPAKAQPPQELDSALSRFTALEQLLFEKDSRLHEKDMIISTLQIELEMLQERNKQNVDASLHSAELKIEELFSKISELEEVLEEKDSELQTVNELIKTLETSEADLVSRNEKLEKASVEQKKHIEKAEQALRVAEATMRRTQTDADAKKKELLKLHQHWLPPWARSRFSQVQASAAKYWAVYGEPYFSTFAETVSEGVGAVNKWANPQIEKFGKHIEQNVSPALKQHWGTITTTVTPHVEIIKTKVVGGYEVSKALLSPHVAKANEIVQPYVQEAREYSRPYIEKVASIVHPHFQQVKLFVRPYTMKLAKHSGRFLASATKFQYKLQSSVIATTKKRKFYEHLATKELTWFFALALLLLPFLGVIFLLSFAFRFCRARVQPKVPIKVRINSHGHKKSRRSRHADK